MIPKRVELENFLSHGEPATVFEFADDEPLWVVCGPNGVGKSAVFDAITYALFGCHRGGKGQGMEDLIRHGANGFRVVLEFEFAGADYRVTRTYNLRGRATQRVERRAGPDGWRAVPGVNSVAEAKAWAEGLLGVGFDAFTASVLLRQGEADRIVTAGGADRLALLKKIIGADRFAALSDRVHVETKDRRAELDRLQKVKDGQMSVTPEELADAAQKAAELDTGRSKAHERANRAAQRMMEAKRWVKLDADRARLGGLIRSADDRAAAADDIRARHARLTDLTAAVPVLRQAVGVRDRLATATDDLKLQRNEHGDLTAERDRLATAVDQERRKAETHRRAAETDAAEAKRLREEHDRESKFVAAAEAVAALRDELKTFPADLDGQLTAAREKVKRLTGDLITTGNGKAEAAGLLKQAAARQKKFATVGIDVECSLCGQTVTAGHAERERDRLADEVRAYTACVAAAEADERKNGTAKAAAEAECERLADVEAKRTTAATQLREKERTLAELGLTADAAALKAALADKAARAGELESQAAAATTAAKTAVTAADKLEDQRKAVADQVAALETAVHRGELAISADQATLTGLVARLSADWQARLDALDAAGVNRLDAERQSFAESGVAEQFGQLEKDAVQRDGWANRLREVTDDIATIPAEAQVPVADAERAATDARRAATAADTERDAAKSAADDLQRRFGASEQLTRDIAAAERAHDLHRRLDDLLGKTGLQRELVRSAERAIVRLAHETAQRLSDGDLAVELDDDADGEDKAFTLRVRRAGDAYSTPIALLSGSQKFRVAVAVALAIGRYAAGRSRPLESVIIDEGFGSLDADGLRAMADELHQLQRTQALRRIVLVSHQEDFYKLFRVGYRLTAGPTGPTATPFRE